MPERLADIENGHNEVYEKRHQRIEEKKAVLLVQEQAKQEAEQTEADADNEKQPQSQEVAFLLSAGGRPAPPDLFYTPPCLSAVSVC